MSDGKSKHVAVETFEAMILMSGSSFDHLGLGTEGNDVLLALSPGQVIDGLGGHDLIFGLAGDNQLNGDDGHDTIFVLRGDNNIVDGGSGNDTVYFWGINRADASIVETSDGRIKVTTPQSTTCVSNVEFFHFRDGSVPVDDLFPLPEYRTFDGTGNNLLNTELGSTDEQLIRLSDAEYSDGISSPAGDDRPSARSVSNELSAQRTTEPNHRNLTDIAWLWGQFLDHDISISEGAAPNESFNISVPAGDALFDPEYTGDVEIHLNRTVYDTATGDSEENPREQINQITAFVDGSMVYGSGNERAAALRSFEGGHLQVTDDNLMTFNDAGFPNADGGRSGADLFLAGDVRANENVALTAMHTLWVREHNRIADELAANDPSLTDEQIYQQARVVVIAEIQAISYNEFLPALLGGSAIGDYTGYNPSVDPSIANEFSTGAYRFGHTMLPSELQRLNNDGSVIDAGNIALRNAFFAPDQITSYGIDSVLLGATRQTANEVDTMAVDDIRNFLFGPPGAGGFDLASLNIQRGRDHGLADYNQVRVDLGLDAVSDFSEITSDVELQQRLKDVYGSVDNIDLWVGGLAEDHVDEASVGETFSAIMIDQFTRLRDGDRFWYESIFDGPQLQLIESTTLSDVIERNTNVVGLQDNVFFLNIV